MLHTARVQHTSKRRLLLSHPHSVMFVLSAPTCQRPTVRSAISATPRGHRPVDDLTEHAVAQVTCHALAHDGRGIARLPDQKIIFVPSLLPGETALVQSTRSTSGYAEGVKLQQVQPPTAAVPAPCPYVDACGGCHLQHVAYEQQLAIKHALVVDALQRIGKLANAPHLVAPIVPSTAQLGYRNNMQFVWDVQRGALGLRPPGTNSEVVAIEACLLQPDTANALLRTCARLLRGSKVVQRVTIRSGYDVCDATLRFVVGFETSNDGNAVRAELEACAKALQEEWGRADLQGVVWTKRRARSRQAVRWACFAASAWASTWHQDAPSVLWGNSVLRETRVGNRLLDVASNSFFQVNPPQADVLFATVRRLAACRNTDTVLDLFCGAGAIGLCLADHVSRVVGIDVDGSAIQAATHSAGVNGVTNAAFHVADLTTISDTLKSQPAVDVVVVDPPRAGLHAALAEWLCTSPVLASARCVVYVSCSAPTLARDVARVAARWRVETVVPVDMFPQTAHVEVVALLVPSVL